MDFLIALILPLLIFLPYIVGHIAFTLYLGKSNKIESTVEKWVFGVFITAGVVFLSIALYSLTMGFLHWIK